MTRLEREVVNLEAQEEEKMLLSGLPIFKDNLTFKHFEYSSLRSNIEEEFKNAKWVVLTTPIVSKQSGKGGNSITKDSLSSNTIQISNSAAGSAMNINLNKTSSSLNTLN